MTKSYSYQCATKLQWNESLLLFSKCSTCETDEFWLDFPFYWVWIVSGFMVFLFRGYSNGEGYSCHKSQRETYFHQRLCPQSPSNCLHHHECHCHQEDEGRAGGGRRFVAEVIGAAPTIGQSIMLRESKGQHSVLKPLCNSTENIMKIW